MFLRKPWLFRLVIVYRCDWQVDPAGQRQHINLFSSSNHLKGERWIKVPFNLYFDSTAPLAPSSPAVEITNGILSGKATHFANPSFTWEDPGDSGTPASGVAGYQVAFTKDPNPANIDANYIYTSTASYTPAALPESGDDGIRYLFIRTKDNVGNLSGWENMFTYVYDTTPP